MSHFVLKRSLAFGRLATYLFKQSLYLLYFMLALFSQGKSYNQLNIAADYTLYYKFSGFVLVCLRIVHG